MDIDKTIREDLAAIADTYAAHADLSMSTVSKKFHGLSTFFDDLKKGECSLTLVKLKKIVDDFSAAWPRDLRWPKTKILRRQRRVIACG